MSNLKISQTYNYDYTTLPNSMTECDNGDFIIVGRAFNKINNSSAFAIRVASNGVMLWDKLYDTPFTQFFSSIATLSDGNFIAVGTFSYSIFAGDEYLWIVKLDNDGDILFQKAIGTVGIQSNGLGVCATKDGGYAIVAQSIPDGIPSSIVLKFNAENNLEWQKTFDVGIAHSIKQTMDGGFVLSGSKNIDNSLLCNPFILRLNESGDSLWLNIYNDYKIYVLLDSDVIENKNGNFTMVAKSVIIQTDAMGNLLWSQQDTSYVLNSIVEVDTGKFAISGSVIINNYDHAYIAVIDKKGTITLWSNTEILYPSAIQKLLSLDENYFATCGYAPSSNGDLLAFFAIFN